MKKILFEAKLSKIYIIVVLLISTLVVGGYFSYAMFTVTKEKKNAISIVTGNLTYELLIDGEKGNALSIGANEIKEFTITLNNPNNRKARFNFYYKGDLPNNVIVGYKVEDGMNIPPTMEGINLEKSGSSGSGNIYKIKISNITSSSITINLGVEVGLDYNDLTLPSDGHLFAEFSIPVIDKILEDNAIQEEKEKMFNYASNGSYITSFVNGKPQYGSETSQVTTGLYQSEDEDGVSYYYRGAVENNNLQYGEYEEDYYVYNYDDRYFQSLKSCQKANSSCSESNKVLLAHAGDKMYWKIVRVNGDGSLRLIYNGTSTTPTNVDITDSWLIGKAPYNLEYDNPKYTGYTYDNGTNSFIKEEVDTWYKNTLGKSSYDTKIATGRFCSDSSGYKLGSEYGFKDYLGTYNLYVSFDRLSQGVRSYVKDNKPTLKCPKTTESYGGSYRLKAGLITADELALAGECYRVEGNSYLNTAETAMYYWTMSPSALNGGGANVWRQFDSLYSSSAGQSRGIRPVINLMTDNGFESGNGTVSSPYVVN